MPSSTFSTAVRPGSKWNAWNTNQNTPPRIRASCLPRIRSIHLLSSVVNTEEMIIPTARFHVTFKMIKRQMFGRAGLALLRKRVLLTAVRH
jgi:hypothetical protein